MSVHCAGSNRPEPRKLADETAQRARHVGGQECRRLVARIISWAPASRLTQTTSVGGSSVASTPRSWSNRDVHHSARSQMQTPRREAAYRLKTSGEIGTRHVASAIAIFDPWLTESAAASIRGRDSWQNFMLRRLTGSRLRCMAWSARKDVERVDQAATRSLSPSR